jgi:hypothetical protein
MNVHVTGKVDDYDPFATLGQAVVGQVSATVTAEGTIKDIAHCTMYLPPALERAVLAGGEGPIAITAALEAGVLQPGTSLQYDTDSLRLLGGELVIGTQVHLVLAVKDHDGSIVSRAGVDLEGVHGGVAGTKRARTAIRARKIEAFVAFAQADLTSSDWPLAGARMSVPLLQIAELRDLASASEVFARLGGAIDLSLTTSRNRDGRYGHDASISARGLSFRSGETSVKIWGDADLGARTNVELTSTTIGKIATSLDRVDIHTTNGDSDHTWLRIAGGHLKVTHDPVRVNGQVRGRLEDLRPVLTHMNARTSLSERVPDRDLTQPLAFDVGIHATRTGITLDLDEVSRTAFNLRGKVRKVGKHTRYAFELLRAHVGVYGHDGAKAKIDLGVGKGWLESKFPWVEALGRERKGKAPKGKAPKGKAP